MARRNTYVIFKKGEALLANKDTKKARKFDGQRKALNFIENMIRVATRQKLTKKDFELVKIQDMVPFAPVKKMKIWYPNG
jgi:hypothetical protein